MKLYTLTNKIIASFISLAMLINSQAYACTMLLVGKKITVDDANIVSRNEDFGGNGENAKDLKYVPAEIKKAGEWQQANGLKIILDKDTQFYAYTATPDAGSDGSSKGGYTIAGAFGEHGVNSQGVVMSATTSIAVNDKANAADPMINDAKGESHGLDESNILFIILPQAKTARNAVELLGEYIEKYGVGEQGNGFGIADDKEVWYFETGSAHHWLAVKVPDNKYLIAANEHRLHNIDLTDKNNVRASTNLFKFTKDNALLPENELNENDFNFAKAFGKIGEGVNQSRVYLAQHLLSDANLIINAETFKKQSELFSTPTKKISIQDVKNVLSATFEGTKYDQGDYLNLENYINIGREVTLETHITQIRSNMPNEFKALTWQAFGPSRHTPYMPVYFGSLKEMPAIYTQGKDKKNSAWWAFKQFAYNAVSAKEVKDGQYTWHKQAKYDAVHDLKASFEMDEAKKLAEIDAKLSEMYKKDPKEAISAAAAFSTNSLNAGFEVVKKFNAN